MEKTTLPIKEDEMEKEKWDTYCFAHIRRRRATLLHNQSLEKKKVTTPHYQAEESSEVKVGACQRNPKGPGPSPVS